jgi:hypothetical protein
VKSYKLLVICCLLSITRAVHVEFFGFSPTIKSDITSHVWGIGELFSAQVTFSLERWEIGCINGAAAVVYSSGWVIPESTATFREGYRKRTASASASGAIHKIKGPPRSREGFFFAMIWLPVLPIRRSFSSMKPAIWDGSLAPPIDKVDRADS